MSATLAGKANGLRIIVLGYLVRGPLGGGAWCKLQYVLGLRRLGHDVYFVEDSDDYPSCYDPSCNVTGIDPTYGLQFAKRAFDRLGLGDRWAYYDAHQLRWHGPCADRMVGICASAELILNVGGVNPLRPWCMEVNSRALLDQDPVFMQIRHLTDLHARQRAEQHTAFLSVAGNIGRDRCTIPDDGLPWQAVRQPVVLDAWPLTPGPDDGRFTTVMLWDSYPAREYDGVRYGMKSDSFDPYSDLPAKMGPVFEIALGGGTAPRDLLRAKQWLLRDAIETTRDPWTYQQFIQRSKAEFSVAKQGYAASRSGWFSERSVNYLASGRPVLVQETGFSDWMQTGKGVVPFSTLEEVETGIQEISGQYAIHCRAAREIAAEYFDARQVLPAIIECAMNPLSANPSDTESSSPER